MIACALAQEKAITKMTSIINVFDEGLLHCNVHKNISSLFQILLKFKVRHKLYSTIKCCLNATSNISLSTNLHHLSLKKFTETDKKPHWGQLADDF